MNILIYKKDLIEKLGLQDGKDGKTPTSKELIRLIKPLIPKTEEQPMTRQEIISLVQSLIPKRESNAFVFETAGQIAKKLNALEEIIEQKTIKGFSALLRNLQRSMKEKRVVGSGGMGNWIHQSFSVDSSTTTVTLSNNIAAGGFAVLAYYNGQYIVRGTHYTQSGKILTLTFTPTDDGDIIDVAYVRA